MTDGSPVRDTLVQMNEGTLERSGLDSCLLASPPWQPRARRPCRTS
jgi:hypothetical protein